MKHYYRSRSSSGSVAIVGIVILVVVAIVGTLIIGVVHETTTGTLTNCTVSDKDRTTTSKGSSDARLYTDCGVLRVQDSLLDGIWNSADLYASIEVGKTYDFDTRGIRLGVMSLFPRVTNAEVVSE